MESFKAKFTETEECNQCSSRGWIMCRFYNKLDCILGDKPSCQPLELLDGSVAAAEEEPQNPAVLMFTSSKRCAVHDVIIVHAHASSGL